jgi:hypothetical protein
MGKNLGILVLVAVFLVALSPGDLAPLVLLDGKVPRGILKSEVLSLKGDPLRMTEPVGDPPISRWEYKDEIVVFEYDRVVDSFAKPEGM